MANKVPVVIQDEEAPVATEIMAKAIIDMDVAMKKLLNGGLKRRAIVALVHDQSGIGKGAIEIVLNNLETLRRDWCTK